MRFVTCKQWGKNKRENQKHAHIEPPGALQQLYSPSPNRLMAFSPNTLRLFSWEIFVLRATGPVTCPGCEESQWGESVASTRRSPPKYSTAHSNRPSSKGSQPT